MNMAQGTWPRSRAWSRSCNEQVMIMNIPGVYDNSFGYIDVYSVSWFVPDVTDLKFPTVSRRTLRQEGGLLWRADDVERVYLSVC
jgi:hypothetical protein